MRGISPEVLSLITYSELNSSTWRRNIINEIILYYIFTEKYLLNQNNLLVYLEKTFHLDITNIELSESINELSKKNEIFNTSKGYVLSEEKRENISKNLLNTNEDIENDKNNFYELCKKYCPSLNHERVYNNFNISFCQALKVSGASMFEVISQKNLERTDWISRFCEKFPPEFERGLNNLMNEYFTEMKPFSKKRILGIIKFFLFYSASKLPKKSLDLLMQKRDKKKIILLLDTNVIFSILDLHYNPYDEAVNVLIDYINKSKHICDIQLRVTSETIEEAKRVLVNSGKNISRTRIRPNMYTTALKYYQGMEKALLEKVSGTLQSIDTLLEYYINSLKTILETKGIKIYNVYQGIAESECVKNDLEKINTGQLTFTDSLNKSPKSIEHDICLWHTVNKERGRRGNEFSEIDIWGVTIDRWMVSFDQEKRKDNELSAPHFLPPLSILQIIRFWVPENNDIEEYVFLISRPAFFSNNFTKQDEEAARSIINTISYFENSEKLPEKAIATIVGDLSLQKAIKTCTSQQALDLIHDALFNNFSELDKKYNDLDGKYRGLEKELHQTTDNYETTINIITSEAENKNTQLLERIKKMEEEYSEKDEKLTILQAKYNNSYKYKYIFILFCYIFVSIIIPVIISTIYIDNINEYIIQFFNISSKNNTLYLLLEIPCIGILCSIISEVLFFKFNNIINNRFFNLYKTMLYSVGCSLISNFIWWFLTIANN